MGLIRRDAEKFIRAVAREYAVVAKEGPVRPDRIPPAGAQGVHFAVPGRTHCHLHLAAPVNLRTDAGGRPIEP